MAKHREASPYKGLAYNYSPKLVCHLKKTFDTYRDAHHFITMCGFNDQGPYLCDMSDHYHLTTNEFEVYNYKAWKIQKEIQKKQKYERWLLRKSFRKIILPLNKGMTHDDIMREIELGF